MISTTGAVTSSGLFTTALALEKLGLEFRFHTTLESTGAITPEGELTADLVLVVGTPDIDGNVEGPAHQLVAVI